MKRETRATAVLRDDLTDLDPATDNHDVEMPTFLELLRENREIERYVGRLEEFERENNVVFVAVNREGLTGVLKALDLLTGGGSGNDELILDDLVKAAIKMTGFEARQ